MVPKMVTVHMIDVHPGTRGSPRTKCSVKHVQNIADEDPKQQQAKEEAMRKGTADIETMLSAARRSMRETG